MLERTSTYTNCPTSVTHHSESFTCQAAVLLEENVDRTPQIRGGGHDGLRNSSRKQPKADVQRSLYVRLQGEHCRFSLVA